MFKNEIIEIRENTVLVRDEDGNFYEKVIQKPKQ